MTVETEEAARAMAAGSISAMGEWIGDMRPWDVFGGLTYDPKRLGRVRTLLPREVNWCRQNESRFRWKDGNAQPMVHREAVTRQVKDWVRDCSSHLGRRLEYVIALERQRFTGQWHAHPLLDCGGVDQADRETMGRLWFARHGISKLDYPRSSQDCATYASKYLAKDMESGDILLSPGVWKQLEGRYAFLEGFARGRTE